MPRGARLFLNLLPLVFVAAAIGQTRPAQSSHQLTVPEIVQRTSSAVVQVVVSDQAGNELGLGSGFLVSSDGTIITNFHVIEGAHAAVVKIANGSLFPVEGVLASDPDGDLAVLKVGGRGLHFLTLDPAADLQVGEQVVAIGSPLGLEGTVSVGNVSALRRESRDKKWIQFTAPVSQGNSGGPLLDMGGNVVGVITWGVSLQKGQNLNFAIPSDDVKSLLSKHGALASVEAVGKSPRSHAERADSTPEAGEQSAVEQLHAIAEAIKKCPKYSGKYGGEQVDPSTGDIIHLGPPANVVWNVESSASVRARYLGTIHYDVPFWMGPGIYGNKFCAVMTGVTDERCRTVWQGMMEDYQRMRAHPRQYLYEFDVTPRGLEYLRGFDKTDQAEDEEWVPSEDLERCAKWAITSLMGSTVANQ